MYILKCSFIGESTHLAYGYIETVLASPDILSIHSGSRFYSELHSHNTTPKKKERERGGAVRKEEGRKINKPAILTDKSILGLEWNSSKLVGDSSKEHLLNLYTRTLVQNSILLFLITSVLDFQKEIF